MYLSEVFVLFFPLTVFGFNIDTNHYIVFVDPEKNGNSSSSYFGYSVVLYPDDKWIKIGAPKGKDPNLKFKNPGTVYHCPFMKQCSPVIISTGYVDPTVDLTDAWRGGSMDVNYKYRRMSICNFRTKYILPYTNLPGSCYIYNINGSTFDEKLPLWLGSNNQNRDRHSVFYFRLGQSGFASHFPIEEDSLILGAPGVYNWAGAMIKIADIYNSPVPSRLSSWREKRSLADTLIADPSLENTFSKSFDLMGYSITSGCFYGANKLYYVAGAPRRFDYIGAVSLFQFVIDNHVTIKSWVAGEQFGEYFGASTASGDLNSDKFDDLIIGAPFHKEKTYNEGAVYIFLGSRYLGQLKKHRVLYGEKTNGQFGSALMFLGDINNDGFGDLAIGAPYEEEYSGVLYIYRGNKEGIDPIYCQKIVGKQISPEIRGFGISISRAADIDENGYNDLVVGAPLSGNAVLLRTKPVVVVNSQVRTIPKELKQDTKQFLLSVCYWYTHFNENTLDLRRALVVDEILSRAVLKDAKEGNKVITIEKGKAMTCENVTIILKNNTDDVSPITVSLSYELDELPKKKEVTYISTSYMKGTDTFCVRCPILDIFRSNQHRSIEVPFSLGCGDDNFCESELTIDAKFPNLGKDNTFVVGSLDYLNLEAIIKNSGENAYSTQLIITLPDIIHLRQLPSECEDYNTSAIICNVGNPLRNNSESSVVVSLDMKKINKGNVESNIHIALKVLTISNNSSPDEKVVTMALRREADIMISGKPEQQSISFGNTTDGMPNFTQIYQVEKIGASPLEKVLVNITLPLSIRTPSGKVTFMKVYPPEATFGGQSVDCKSNIKYIEGPKGGMSEKLMSGIIPRRKRQVEVFKMEVEVGGYKTEDIVVEGEEYDLAPNTTVFLNCSMEDVVCSSILCTVGPFERKQTPATIEIRMMFNTSAISLGEKYMVLYSSQGTAVIQIPSNFIQNGDRPDFVEVSSLFINAIAEKHIALWIIILAVIIGILLLALIIYGLTKVGFFKRTKKEELKNLKAASKTLVEAESAPEVLEPAPEPSEQTQETLESTPGSMDPTLNASTEGLIDQDLEDDVII